MRAPVSFAAGTDPLNMAFDGAHIWVGNNNGNSVTKLRASDGANLGTFPLGTNPTGIAFDGANIWVALHVGGNAVVKM